MNQNEAAFSYKRRVAFYDTDAMGVVHHSNYVRYLEDARVDWMRQSGLLKHHAPEGDFVFAVHELSVSYKRPLKFDDEIEVWMQAKLDGVRIRIQYAVEKVIGTGKILVATGKTVLIPLDDQFSPMRLPPEARELFKNSPWSDDWLSRV